MAQRLHGHWNRTRRRTLSVSRSKALKDLSLFLGFGWQARYRPTEPAPLEAWVMSQSTSQKTKSHPREWPFFYFPECFWSGREDLNLRPLGPESWVPQHSYMLLFKKLQPPSNSAPFTIFYHVLTSLPRRLLSLLDTNWTQIFGAHDRFSASDRSHGPRPCSLLSSRFDPQIWPQSFSAQGSAST